MSLWITEASSAAGAGGMGDGSCSAVVLHSARGRWFAAIGFVRSDEFHAPLALQPLIKRGAVIGVVGDQLFRAVRGKCLLEGGFHQSGFMW